MYTWALVKEIVEKRFVQGKKGIDLSVRFKDKYQTEKEELIKIVSNVITDLNLEKGRCKCFEIAAHISPAWM